jgi:hypothetical protein
MSEFVATVGKKLASIAAGILVLIGLSWARGCFSRGTDGPAPSGPPVPAGRFILKLDGADVELAGVKAYIEHPDSGAVRLVFESDTLLFEGPMDLNGDGRCNGKDEFEGDIDDVASCNTLIGRTFRLKGSDDEWVTLDGAGKCAVVEATITPREYWRPKGYDGTDGWRADVELKVKVSGAEKTLGGRLEGPVTHTW